MKVGPGCRALRTNARTNVEDATAGERIVQLHAFDKSKQTLLGWCREALPLDDECAWVCSTRVGKTRFHENLLWVRNMIKDNPFETPTHFGLYDLRTGACIDEVDLEPFGINVLFGILPVPV